MNRILVIFALLYGISVPATGQELMCQVSVNAQQISGTDRSVYDNMQTAIREFMNTRQWTPYTYKVEERIDCSILINLSERISDEEYRGTMQIQSRRPVYGTSYFSVMLNFMDRDVQFKYLESQALDFDENSHTSNLTSILAYWANMIIGLDMDSYTSYGGSPFFTKAQTIVTNAQNAAEKGWKAFENRRNRYWIVENLLNTSTSSLRDCLYNYHLKGLDQMKDNIQTGRAGVTSAIESLQKAHRESPTTYFTTLFVETKRDEICNIYSEASVGDKNKVVAILKEIDPANSNVYNTKILNAGK